VVRWRGVKYALELSENLKGKDKLEKRHILDDNIVTCRVVRVTNITGSSSDDWIY
jgi:hypothetical protein